MANESKRKDSGAKSAHRPVVTIHDVARHAGVSSMTVSRVMTGKPARQLRTKWTEAWDRQKHLVPATYGSAGSSVRAAVGGGQRGAEVRPARGGFDVLQRAAHLSQDGSCDGETKPRALTGGLGRREGLEETGENVG